ncbi:hypothetical protein O181_113993 [Austropuccinia psidii MF-1]|uniref:Uncharacterized protein n=1 Tax=Austropuccinia psidii MF-1 TaxID=1389203 RepID=A0A9Q3PU63_9BASI|nr:hypothetical protein [Austropuccinia psidii MF-1]
MGQALLKEVPKLKEWPHFSVEEEYDLMDLIRGIEKIGEYSELTDRFLTARFMSACDSKPEHKHDSQNTINQWYSQDTTKTWT